ncbi:uncharacterized protein [Onthophagus taurus]|uniref:uncharacterized protein isoform X2 n=1 Tax=Onthophagus taurus TaxID=166361 RepID=UPI000C20EA19|nr:zinc finger and BTB domain-containing protein 37-like isoform X2 [Onthophagus taurus]
MESEQFSLCWNNFHNNLSSGFHTLLRDEDLVDVTLAAEGKYLKAHKTVLSVCSPYFKELFRVNPCDHPIVILQDVKYTALQSLLEFMYQGEVSVSQEEIPMFMRVADVLKIKGLSENANNKETNGLDSNHKFDPTDSKQYLKRKSMVKKIIKPIQHLRPIEPNLPIKSPPMVRSPITPQSPAKQPRIETPVSASESNLDVVTPKQEPIDEDFSDAYDDSMDVSSMIDTSLGETSDFKPNFSTAASCSGIKQNMDTSSPGSLYFLKSRRGHPVLIHSGHMYTLSHRRETKSTWICVKQKTLNCEGCVTTTHGNTLLSYSGHNHAQLNNIIQRLQATSCSPSPEL